MSNDDGSDEDDTDDEDGGLGSLPHNGTATSKAAAKIAAKTQDQARLEIMQHLVAVEPDGATPDATQVRYGRFSSSFSARFGVLARDGLARDTGETRPTRTGSPAAVWRPTQAGLDAIASGTYTGEQVNKEKRVPHVQVLREAIGRLARGWSACTTDPDHLKVIAELERLAVMTCSQWGTHPHEMRPAHDATGIAKMTFDQFEPGDVRRVAIFSLCRQCADEDYLTDPRFQWVRKP